MNKKKLLNGVRILDLSRILAGPWATQLLADYGAEVIKVERPNQGDDTRNWGPPWKVNQLNNQRRDAAYFFSTNRNKRSLTCDFSTQEGAAIVKDLVKYCDVVIENFKVGTLGMYAVSAILASLYQREQNGEIQDINVPLFDSQVSWLANQNMNYLIGGINPAREGTAHPNIAPYQVFPTKDEDIMLAVGNDNQFERLMECFGDIEENLINKFNKNSQRIENKEELINFLSERLKMHSASYWLTLFDEKSIPCGPINDIAQVFNSDYAKEQNLVRYGKNKHNKKIPTVANPIRFSDYDTQYDNAAPTLGEHTNLILKKLLNYTDEEIKTLKVKNII
jgi:crotonobetainyl-CoA:carnitine CoA-transferase CaiB-like acyl-CoA transferase